MDPELEKKFSFPNSDRYDPNAKQQAQDLNQPRPVVHITDALNIVPKKESGVEPNIRTFQADIADAIKNDNVSMIQMALSEKKRQEKRGNFEQAVEIKKNNNLFYTASIGIAILILIVFSGFIFYITSGSKSSTNTVATNSQITEPLIYTEESIALNTNNRDSADIESLIRKEKEVKLELGNMKSILLTSGSGTSTQLLNTGDFLTLMRARVSDSLIRALDDNFLLGIYSFNPYDTFMVFRINSYDNAFAGMLQWENSMESDLGGLIITKRITLAPPVVSIPTTNTVTASSTAKEATKATTTSQVGGFKRHIFIDKVLQNKDSRVLIDERGAILMLYSFLDKNTLVITSSDKALKEVLFRLTTGRIVR